MKFEILLSDFQNDLKRIKKQNSKQIIQCNKVIQLSRDILSKMNLAISNSCFLNDDYEIHFFKNVKSVPLSQLIYFSEIKDLELKFPKIGISLQQKYLERKIKRINRFFQENITFVSYIQNDYSHLDTIYFTRKHFSLTNLEVVRQYYRAPEFSTSHDFLLAKYTAFNLLINYIQNKLFIIKNPETSIQDIHSKSHLRWTSSKVALTELIYGLHSSGAINSGAVDIKELAKLTERFFNVELGDYYRTYLAIRNRKINRTKFIDRMRNSLLDDMDKKDE